MWMRPSVHVVLCILITLVIGAVCFIAIGISDIGSRKADVRADDKLHHSLNRYKTTPHITALTAVLRGNASIIEFISSAAAEKEDKSSLFVIVYRSKWSERVLKAQRYGGPAGELALFNTLIAALNHIRPPPQMIVTEDDNQLATALKTYAGVISAIYIDQLNDYPQIDHMNSNKRLYRLLDFWGTPPEQNHPKLHLKQYLCPYDYGYNTNMPFIVYPPNEALMSVPIPTEPYRLCVWGKLSHYFTETVNERLTAVYTAMTGRIAVHATVGDSSKNEWARGRSIPPLPAFIHNDGVQPNSTLWQTWLSRCLVLVGVGDPVLGPTVFEAVSYGVTYIDWQYAQSRRLPDLNGRLSLNSQHHYAVQMIPQPHVIAVDWMKNIRGVISAIEDAMERAKRSGRTPFIHETQSPMAVARVIEENIRNAAIQTFYQ